MARGRSTRTLTTLIRATAYCELVTWNCCRGSYLKKAALLQAWKPDIAVIQECARPVVESDTCIWFGDSARQGVAVQAAPPYGVRRLPQLKRVPKFIVPIAVSGPIALPCLLSGLRPISDTITLKPL